MKLIKKILFYMLVVIVSASMMIPTTVGTTLHVQTTTKISNDSEMPFHVASTTQASLQKVERKQYTNTVQTMSRNTDILLFDSEYADENPAITSDEYGDILVLDENRIGASYTNLWGRWSTDTGETWNDEIYGWNFDNVNTLPKLDAYGQGKTAWGTIFTAPENPGYIYYIGFPDMTDPTVPDNNNPEGWTVWYDDWAINGYTIHSTDVACYSNTSNIPSPEFWGIVACTADVQGQYPEDNTMVFQYFTPGQQIQSIYFYNMQQDLWKMSTDIDQSNGKFYMCMEYYNHPTKPDGTVVFYNSGIKADENWWQSGWNAKYFPGLSNPDITANNGNVYIVGEEIYDDIHKGIVCYHSSNSGGTFTKTIVSQIPLLDELFPSISLARTLPEQDTVICSYFRGGNLYASVSSDSGSSWQEVSPAVNDVEGSVVENYSGASVYSHYASWTDNRNGQTDIYFDRLSLPNQPPYTPSDPYPVNGAGNVPTMVDLSWTSGDPDGDPVTYDVFFGTTNPPPKVQTNQSETTYYPGPLDYTKYYWRIIAYDNNERRTDGPLWTFTTLNLINILISSDNPNRDDEHPKITRNNEGALVVTYEKEIDTLHRVIPITYSKNLGQTWTEQFEIDSANMQEGSGYLQSPDIKYCSDAQQFFWQAIDPLALYYNEEMFWIPKDIENTTEIDGTGISFEDVSDYTEGALTFVGEWGVFFIINTCYSIVKTPGIQYLWNSGTDFLWPREVDPSWAYGAYYDAQSILHTAEASKPELATGDNRIYMVMESFNEGTSKISFKATVTDLNPSSPTFLFTRGGGPQGMDKYADVDVWPLKQEYIAVDATDPDISADGSVVAVVYTQNGDVTCSASTNDGDTWTVSTIATDAGYPAVHVAGNNIYCVYVKDHNLYLVNSINHGTTWSSPSPVNDEEGTVVAEPGCADVSNDGIVWTDNRNGHEDIYFEKLAIGTHVGYVDDDYNETTPGWQIDHFNNIQDGVNAITNGGTLYVFNGTYHETISIVGKRLNLIGEDQNGTIIDGTGFDCAVYISSQYVTMQFFSIRNSIDKGIYLFDSAYITLDHLHVYANEFIGIYIVCCGEIILSNSDLEENYLGVWNIGSYLITMEENTFISNIKSGIRLLVAQQSIIVNNWFENNHEGIYIEDIWSTINEIYHNNFINNSAVDYSSNNWNNNYPSGGNYWNDYTGMDNFHGENQDIPQGDGIGDVPYSIQGGYNQDQYPFMQPDGWNINLPPYMPTNPSPPDGAINVEPTVDLSWSCDDPTGDQLTYDVYFGTICPPPKIYGNQTENTYDLPVLAASTLYYWRIAAWDTGGRSTQGPTWTFTTRSNTPPNMPKNPSPPDGAMDVTIDADLSWTGGDPDPGDTVTYDIFFGSTIPPQKVVSNQTSLSYDPGVLMFITIYYWQIIAWDNNGASTQGPLWSFTTKPNNPPNTPSNPSPSNGSIDVPLTLNLSWTGGDPDTPDIVTYDVYFGQTPSPEKVASNQTSTTYQPGILTDDTTYYWQIIAWDNNGASTPGPLWQFKTINLDLVPPEYRNQGQNRTFVPPGTNISLYAQGRDDVALNWAWLATNETGEWKNFTAGGNWWNNTWLYRKKIVIHHENVAGTLTDFPILVTTRLDRNKVQLDGDDILFTNDNSSVKYNHEIEYYNNTTGELFAWVKINQLNSAQDTAFYIYYGNPTCSNQENTDQTWDTNYQGVWHMTESATPIRDSTSYQNHGTQQGNPLYRQLGKIGNAISLDGNDDFFSLTASLMGNSGTIEAWVNVSTENMDRCILTKGQSYSNDQYFMFLILNNNHVAFYSRAVGAGGANLVYGDTPLNPGWHYIVGQSNGNSWNIYVDGHQETLTVLGGQNNGEWFDDFSGDTYSIGMLDRPDDYGPYKGTLDELRVESSQLTPAWITTSYNNQNNPTTFTTFGDEEIYGHGMQMQHSSDWQWSNFTWQNFSIPTGQRVGWRIYYNDTSGNINCTPIKNFTIGNPPSQIVLDGYCYYQDMTPVNTMTAEIINLNTSERWQPNINNNYYSITLQVGDDIVSNQTIRILVKDENESVNVTDHVITASDIATGHLTLDLILDVHYRDLKQFPFYLSQVNTGAMVMKMMMDYLMWNSTIDLSGPPSVYNEQTLYNIYSGGNSINGTELSNGLNTEVNDQGNGWIYGYNFNPYNNTNANEVLKQICVWLDYPIDYFNYCRTVLVPKPGHPNHVPIAVPTGGNYDNWMVVRGIYTDRNAWLPPAQVTVYGFWLNDPKQGGLGGNTYVTASRFLSTYFLQLNVPGDPYNSQFLAITDPARAMNVSTDETTVTLAETPAGFTRGDAQLVTQHGKGADSIVTRTAYTAAWDVLKHDVKYADSFATAKVVGKPTYEKNICRVLFASNTTSFTVRLNKRDGSLLEIQINDWIKLSKMS